MPKNDIRVGLLSLNETSLSPNCHQINVTDNNSLQMRLIVNGRHLIIQSKCSDAQLISDNRHVNGSNGHHNDDPQRYRTVHLTRNPQLGLGLSIKGGAEHHFPILISRIVKDSPADRSKQLYIGDEIIAVNGNQITCNTSHDEALHMLRGSGDEIILQVRHHKAATILEKTWKKHASPVVDLEKDNPLINKKKPPKLPPKPQNTTWTECVRMELFLAHLSLYLCYSDKMRDAGFEIRSCGGQSAVVQCDSQQICHEWCNTITTTIDTLTDNYIKQLNSSVEPSEHVLFMGWVAEGSSPIKHQPRLNYKWSHRFLIIKGGSLYVFIKPPQSLIEKHEKLPHNFSSDSLSYHCYQSVFRCVKSSELMDERQNCFILQSADEPLMRYFSAESAEDLAKIKTCWHRANYNSVTHLGSKTFAVNGDGRSGSLTLDWKMGFAFYDTQAKEYKWKYRFHQLKHSSDDGRSRLSLTFVTNPSDSRITETQLIECTSLQNLLYCMHAFLSAKVASVDPRFLQSC